MKQRTESAIQKSRQQKIPNQSSKEKNNIFKNEGSLRDLWENKCNNIHITEVPEKEGGEQGIVNLFEEIIIENFPHLVKEKETQVQKHRESPPKMERQPTEWKKIFANDTSENELISESYKEVIPLNTHTQT